MDELALAMSAIFFASCLQGIVGFGSGLVSMSLLSIIWPVAFTTTVLNPLGLALSLSLAWQNRKAVSFKAVRVLILGLPIGIYLGLRVLNVFSEAHLKLLLAIALLVAVGNTLWMKPQDDESQELEVQRTHPVFGAISGVFSGLCGASLSASGPPVLVYASFARWPKESYRANLSIFFAVTSFLSCIGLALSGLLTTESLKITAWLIPVSLLGSVTGYRLGSLVPQLHFTRLTLALLTLIALRFIAASIA